MMWGYGYELGWMWLWGVFLLAGITVLVILAVRLLTGGLRHDGPGLPPGQGQIPPQGQGGPPGPTPVSPQPPVPTGRSQARLILDERFARGELTAEQYRENLKVLGEES
ncbi:SHOCT domain-containing protein [Arthrobacter sp. 2MCAF15]|uniref:SHOCT domain-containing protein n=1 Tax=Arthrobacter sp. 2MCAF15 TaxID=3232984 RepID=UPI003F8DE6E0